MRLRMFRYACLGSVLALAAAAASGKAPGPGPAVDPSLLGALSYRMIGPYRGGRVTAVAGIARQPFTFFMGSTGGGVWKTESAGQRWTNVSDGFFAVGSIGAIAVAPSDPNVVYVGTGSACPRGNVSVGNGVYRSTDGGRTWAHVGLSETGQIGRIVVDPTDADRVWVAALGHIFGPNPERGVYRSTDGGATWERVLFVSETAGAVDLSLNPRNPRELYAAIWRVERKPWTLVDGGEESGLYRSTDRGDSWERLAGGLPDGELGRIGVAISPARPARVWALVTAAEDRGGLFRSDDSGKSWERVSRDRELQTRGWYYSHVVAHPTDPDTVFVLNVRFHRSIDGGRTFSRVTVPHGDNHALWVNPTAPRIMISGNDGGATVTLDGGRVWSTELNQPTAEFYRVTVDDRLPYRVYGAQQDNSTLSIPSWLPASITAQQRWYAVGGAESGHIAIDPRDPDRIFAGNFIGRIDRFDLRTETARNVILYPQMQDGTAPKDLAYRFQWNAPILISRHDPEVVYHASNFVHRTRDDGMTWETVSPDLTRDDPAKQELPGGPVQHDHTGVEVYDTIFALAESPHAAGELWAGSDDGLVHLTRDGGASWRDVTPPQMPEDCTVNVIEPSPHRPGRVYLACYRYRLDDFRPYIFRTDDHGAHWRLLTDGANGIPEDHPVRVVREDPEREDLLYAGTEFGLFVSFDGGARWQSLQLDLPRVPVTDLVVHDGDLVVATQGRSFWILDDLSVLRQVRPRMEEEAPLFFQPRDPSPLAAGPWRGGARTGEAPKEPPRGVVLWYYFRQEPDAEVELEIRDGQGRVLRRFASGAEKPAAGEHPDPSKPLPLPAEAGLNRLVWDLRLPPLDLVEGAVMSLARTDGLQVLPGRYEARLEFGDWSVSRAFTVRPDPRLPEVTAGDLEARFALARKVQARVEAIHRTVRGFRSVREQLEALLERSAAAGVALEAESRLREAVQSLREALDAAEKRLIQTRSEASQDPINFPPRIDDQFAYLYSHLAETYGRPSAGAYRRFEDLQREVEPLLAKAKELLGPRLGTVNRLVEELGLGGILVPRSRTAGDRS